MRGSFLVNSILVVLFFACGQQRPYDVRYTGRVLAFNEKLGVQTSGFIRADEAGSAKSSARAAIQLGSFKTGSDGRFDFVTKGARSNSYWLGLNELSDLIKIQSNSKREFKLGDIVLETFIFKCNVRLRSIGGDSVRLISNLQHYRTVGPGKDTTFQHRFSHNRNSFNLFTDRYPLMFETIKSNGQKITDTVLIQINNTSTLSHTLDY